MEAAGAAYAPPPIPLCGRQLDDLSAAPVHHKPLDLVGNGLKGSADILDAQVRVMLAMDGAVHMAC